MSHFHFPKFADQTMVFAQFLGEFPQQLPLLNILDPGHNLGGEIFTLHTRHRKQIANLLFQPSEAFLNYGFDTGWESIPIQFLSLNPIPFSILDQVTSLLHCPQQLHSKEWVAPGVVEEGLAEPSLQQVGFAVQEGIDEIHFLPRLNCAQVERYFSLYPLEFVDHLVQRMPIAVTS